MAAIAAAVAYLLLRLSQYDQGIIRDEGIRATARIGLVFYIKYKPISIKPSRSTEHDAQQRWMRQGGGRPTAAPLRPTVPRAPCRYCNARRYQRDETNWWQQQPAVSFPLA